MKNIVVVDDDSDILFTIENAIKYYNNQYLVTTLKSGKELIKFLKKNKPDLILLDLMMPEMTGWEVFDKIKENKEWTDIPIIIISSVNDDKNITNAYKNGDDYIKKPFTFDILMDKIEKIFTEI